MGSDGTANGRTGARLRPRYVPRQVVQAADLNVGQDYLLGQLRRHNRLLHGCGVVCGLVVDAVPDDESGQRLRVSAGTALDGAGNTVEVSDDVAVRITDLPRLFSSESGRRTEPPAGRPDPCEGGDDVDRRCYLAICHREVPADRRAVVADPCAGAPRCEHVRVRDDYELLLLDDIEEGDCVERDAPSDETAWLGEYHHPGAHEDVPSSEPDLVRSDPHIAFRWPDGRPDPGFPAGRFAVRWTRQLYLPAGRHRFRVAAAGGVRLRIDDHVALESLDPVQEADHTTDLVLAPGARRVVVDYVAADRSDGAVSERARRVVAALLAEHVASVALMARADVFGQGFAAVVRDAVAEAGAEVVAEVAYDPQATRFDREVDEVQGADPDGIVVVGLEERRLVVDALRDAGIGPDDLPVHEVTRPGAPRISLTWEPVALGWHAAYHRYEGNDPPTFDAAELALVTIDPGIALDLAIGESPHPGLPSERFLVRWQRDVEITAAGDYEFAVTTDDGMRLIVDGETILDRWFPQSPTPYRARRMLGPGRHRILVEYYERTGRAVAKVSWRWAGPFNPVCPPPLHPGCVVLAALDVRGGRVVAVENAALDPARGYRRHTVPTAAALGSGLATTAAVDTAPLIAGLVPDRGSPGTQLVALLFGRNLGGTTRVDFDGEGVSATVLPGATDTSVPLAVTVAPGAAPGLRRFQVTTPHCTFRSADYGGGAIVFQVQVPPPAPTPIPTVGPTIGPTIVPTLVPTFGPTFSPTISPTIVPTVVPTVFPTVFPTVGPTISPTISPTIVPTFGPTFVPTFGPTFIPISGPILEGPGAGLRVDVVPSIDAAAADRLASLGIGHLGMLAVVQPGPLAEELGISEVRAMALVEEARRLTEAPPHPGGGG